MIKGREGIVRTSIPSNIKIIEHMGRTTQTNKHLLNVQAEITKIYQYQLNRPLAAVDVLTLCDTSPAPELLH